MRAPVCTSKSLMFSLMLPALHVTAAALPERKFSPEPARIRAPPLMTNFGELILIAPALPEPYVSVLIPSEIGPPEAQLRKYVV
jgi:hypothetical protein